MTQKKPITLDFLDFDPDPNGFNDSTQAFQLALETIRQYSEDVVLNIPTGEYHFWKHHATPTFLHISNTSSLEYPVKYVSILIQDLSNLTINGNHSKFIFHGDHMAIGILNSNNISINNLTIDYSDPDTIDITIVDQGFSEDKGFFTDFFIPSCFSYKISDPTTITWYGDINPETNTPFWSYTNADFIVFLVIFKSYNQTIARAPQKKLSNPFKNIKYAERIEENILRIYYLDNYPLDQELGNTFLLCDSATRRTSGFFINQSENISLNNLNIHYLSGFGLMSQMSKNLTFDHIYFLPRQGTSKKTTSNADQLHFAGIGGKLIIKNCHFSLAHDDPINIHGTYLRVEEVIDKRTLKLKYVHTQQGGFQQFFPGNEVLFYSRNDLQSITTQNESLPYIIKKSYPPGTKFRNILLDWQTEIIEFETEFDDQVIGQLKQKINISRNDESKHESLFVAENITYTPEVLIENNWFKSIPTRGILATTRKPSIIKNNFFENISMANIFLSNDAEYWYESGPIQSMKIEYNTFILRSSGQREWSTVPALLIEPVLLKTETPSKLPIHQNIQFNHNKIYLGNDNLITGSHVKELTIRKNDIYLLPDSYQIKTSLSSIDYISSSHPIKISGVLVNENLKEELIELENTENLKFENNTLQNNNLKNYTNENCSDFNLPVSHLEILHSNIKFWTDRPDLVRIHDDTLYAIGNGTAKIIAYCWQNDKLFTSKVYVLETIVDQPEYKIAQPQLPFLELLNYLKINDVPHNFIGNISNNYWESHFIKLNQNEISFDLQLFNMRDHAKILYSFAPHNTIEQHNLNGNFKSKILLPNGITHLEISIYRNSHLLKTLYFTLYVPINH